MIANIVNRSQELHFLVLFVSQGASMIAMLYDAKWILLRERKIKSEHSEEKEKISRVVGLFNICLWLGEVFFFVIYMWEWEKRLKQSVFL